MTRLGVVIDRKNYYRLLAPVVEAALARGWEVVCFHDYAQVRTGTKGAEFPDVSAVPAFRSGAPRVETYRGSDSLPEALDRAGVTLVVSLGLPPERLRVGATPGRVGWVSLQYHGEIFSLLAPPAVLAVDALGIYGPWWLEAAVSYFRTRGLLERDGADERALRAKAAVVGFPEMDQFDSIDAAEVRRRWRLPERRPIVLFLPYPFRSNPQTPWCRWAYRGGNRAWRRLRLRLAGERALEQSVVRGWDDKAVARAVRAFCDANDALLVVKSRAKDPVPGYVARLADLTLYDESYYPPTILEALAVARLCIHFYSTTVFEVVGAGVPSLCLCPSSEEMGTTGGWWGDFYTRREGGPFQFRGIAETVSIPEAIETLPGQRLEDIVPDPAAREAYTARFLTLVDGKSAGRLLDLAQAVQGSGPRRQ